MGSQNGAENNKSNKQALHRGFFGVYLDQSITLNAPKRESGFLVVRGSKKKKKKRNGQWSSKNSPTLIMDSYGGGRHQVLWVVPSQTKKTPEDEIDDLICAPCLRGMRRGSCGKPMVDQIRLMFKMEKGLAGYPEVAAGQLRVIDCWRQHPKEYAKELPGVEESNYQALRRVAAGDMINDGQAAN